MTREHRAEKLELKEELEDHELLLEQVPPRCPSHGRVGASRVGRPGADMLRCPPPPRPARERSGEGPMGTTADGGGESKGRAANGDRAVGAARHETNTP